MGNLLFKHQRDGRRRGRGHRGDAPDFIGAQALNQHGVVRPRRRRRRRRGRFGRGRSRGGHHADEGLRGSQRQPCRTGIGLRARRTVRREGARHLLGHHVRASLEEGLASASILAGLCQSEAKVVVGFGVFRGELHRPLEFADGARQLSGLQVNQAEVDPQGGVGRVVADEAFVNLGGPVKVPKLEVGQPQKVLALLVVRLQLVGGLQLGARILQLASLEEFAAPVEQRQESVVSPVPGITAMRNVRPSSSWPRPAPVLCT